MVDGVNVGKAGLDAAGSVVNLCEVCQVLHKAPHLPIADTSQASALNERLQVDLHFLYDVITLHAMDLFPKYPLLARVLPNDPLEVWGASATSQIAALGNPRGIQSAGDEEWDN